MKRIGIYLESERACGGTHQYNRVMVEVLSRLPRDEFLVKAIYTAAHWEGTLKTLHIVSTYYAIPRYARWLIGAWRRLQLPVSWWRTIATRVHPLARLMAREECDVWIFPSQDALAYWIPVNAITTIHDLMHRYERRFPEVGDPKEYAWREFHYAHVCRFAKGILVDSHLGKQHVMESYAVDPQQCHVLPYVPPLDFCHAPVSDIDKTISLPEKYLFYPAQFWQHKNHRILLKAMAILSPVLPDLQLVLVGSVKNGWEDIRTLIETEDLSTRVHVLGLVEDAMMPLLYQRARALVMPTFFGPTNIPPLEAFCSNCPVLISGIYAMKEQLGEAALYFDPQSVDSLAHAITRIWSDDTLVEELRQRGREWTTRWNINAFQATLQTFLTEF